MPACGRPSPPRRSVSVIAGGGAAIIKVAERHDLGVSRETTRRQNINHDSESCPPRVSNAIFFAIAACGSVANKVETRWSASSCRSPFALPSSFERKTLTVCDDAPKNRGIDGRPAIPHLLIFGAGDDQRFLVVMEDRKKKEFRVGENDFVLVTAQSRDLKGLGVL